MIALDPSTSKCYIRGTLLKKNVFEVNGKPSKMRKWLRYYVELIGHTLHFWEVSEIFDKKISLYYTKQTGTMAFLNPHELTDILNIVKSGNSDNFEINVSNSSFNAVGSYHKRQHVWELQSEGANKYYFVAQNVDKMHEWVDAMRLAMSDYYKMCQIKTQQMIFSKYSYFLNDPVSKDSFQAKFKLDKEVFWMDCSIDVFGAEDGNSWKTDIIPKNANTALNQKVEMLKVPVINSIFVNIGATKASDSETASFTAKIVGIIELHTLKSKKKSQSILNSLEILFKSEREMIQYITIASKIFGISYLSNNFMQGTLNPAYFNTVTNRNITNSMFIPPPINSSFTSTRTEQESGNFNAMNPPTNAQGMSTNYSVLDSNRDQLISNDSGVTQKFDGKQTAINEVFENLAIDQKPPKKPSFMSRTMRFSGIFGSKSLSKRKSILATPDNISHNIFQAGKSAGVLETQNPTQGHVDPSTQLNSTGVAQEPLGLPNPSSIDQFSTIPPLFEQESLDADQIIEKSCEKIMSSVVPNSSLRFVAAENSLAQKAANNNQSNIPKEGCDSDSDYEGEKSLAQMLRETSNSNNPKSTQTSSFQNSSYDPVLYSNNNINPQTPTNVQINQNNISNSDATASFNNNNNNRSGFSNNQNPAYNMNAQYNQNETLNASTINGMVNQSSFSNDMNNIGSFNQDANQQCSSSNINYNLAATGNYSISNQNQTTNIGYNQNMNQNPQQSINNPYSHNPNPNINSVLSMHSGFNQNQNINTQYSINDGTSTNQQYIDNYNGCMINPDLVPNIMNENFTEPQMLQASNIQNIQPGYTESYNALGYGYNQPQLYSDMNQLSSNGFPMNSTNPARMSQYELANMVAANSYGHVPAPGSFTGIPQDHSFELQQEINDMPLLGTKSKPDQEKRHVGLIGTIATREQIKSEQKYRDSKSLIKGRKVRRVADSGVYSGYYGDGNKNISSWLASGEPSMASLAHSNQSILRPSNSMYFDSTMTGSNSFTGNSFAQNHLPMRPNSHFFSQSYSNLCAAGNQGMKHTDLGLVGRPKFTIGDDDNIALSMSKRNSSANFGAQPSSFESENHPQTGFNTLAKSRGMMNGTNSIYSQNGQANFINGPVVSRNYVNAFNEGPEQVYYTSNPDLSNSYSHFSQSQPNINSRNMQTSFSVNQENITRNSLVPENIPNFGQNHATAASNGINNMLASSNNPRMASTGQNNQVSSQENTAYNGNTNNDSRTFVVNSNGNGNGKNSKNESPQNEAKEPCEKRIILEFDYSSSVRPSEAKVFEDFIEKCIELKPYSTINCHNIYAAYTNFCKRNGVKAEDQSPYDIFLSMVQSTDWNIKSDINGGYTVNNMVII